MANLVDVTDATDERLADYVQLRDVALRRSLEVERGLFIAEGEKVIRRAVEAGYPVRSLLVSPRWLESLSEVLAAHPDVECFVAPEDVVERVSGFHVHRGALAAMARRELPSPRQVLRDARRVVVLEDVNDHSNVGAIFRNAAAFGMEAVLLSPRCADPLYRRAIKVSMGTVFRVPYARAQDWSSTPELLREHGFSVVALTPASDAVDIASIGPSVRTALLVGSEGHGLSARWMAGSDVRARIPIAAGVDSLNVAAATAVACYALGTQTADRFGDQITRVQEVSPDAS